MPNWIKQPLCGDNWFGNIFYPLWRDLECFCCAYWRGFLSGAVFWAILETMFDVIPMVL